MQIILSLIFLLVVIMGCFYTTVWVIMLFNGISYKEAIEVVQDYFRNDQEQSLENDSGFEYEISENVRAVLGDRRFEELIKLSYTAVEYPLLFFTTCSNLPTIGVSVQYNDENERIRLEKLITRVTEKYIMVHGYYKLTKIEWRIRRDLNIPYLQIQYAKNDRERKTLTILLESERQSFFVKNNAVIDESEEELYE